jgi:GDP-mannose transporter
VHTARALHIIQYEDFDWGVARRWLPINIFFICMLFTSTLSLKYLTVHMVTIFKNLTNVFIVYGEWAFLGQQVTSGVILSLLLMVLGSVMGGITDLELNWLGYGWMAANCLATAGYTLYMRGAAKNFDISEFGMAFYNNALSLPLLATMSILTGEVDTITSFSGWYDPLFILAILFSGSLGFAMSLSSFWLVSVTSATTYAVVGALNKFPLAILAIFLFKSVVTLSGSISILLGIGGGLVYTRARYVMNAAVKKRANV